MSAATNAQQYQRVWGRLEAGEAVEKVAEDEASREWVESRDNEDAA